MTVYVVVYYDASAAGYMVHQMFQDRNAAQEELRRFEARIASQEFGNDVRSADVIEINCDAATNTN